MYNVTILQLRTAIHLQLKADRKRGAAARQHRRILLFTLYPGRIKTILGQNPPEDPPQDIRRSRAGRGRHMSRDTLPEITSSRTAPAWIMLGKFIARYQRLAPRPAARCLRPNYKEKKRNKTN
ncbi:hypothetical protein EVAR_52873_1 [Eumeta japonica]|uniref:Uncharacterized protein n=1 Tax=Eumeta variegata TaxID=151549 RepID=A0A4C1YMK7_EUMVA|nr:hypothetical protein EVAR_52873_1 [Eumeta japonica]